MQRVIFVPEFILILCECLYFTGEFQVNFQFNLQTALLIACKMFFNITSRVVFASQYNFNSFT